MRAVDDIACLKPACENFGKPGLNIVGHGWFTTKSGRRPRHRCKICGGTVSLNTSTPYRGLRCGRTEFDQVASLRVEGVSISATARVTGRSRNTIARWLDRASRAAAHFNRHILRDFEVRELQADELYTFIGSKRRPTWLFATIEVASRLWASSLVGRRSSRNTMAVLDDVILSGRLVGVPLIATDGFEPYGAVIQRLVGSACVYGQIIKTRRNDRIVRVERRVKIGTATQLMDALMRSEDSEHLNTSFIERLNLTIRQGSAYLRRCSPCHARGEDQLRGHVELLRCHDNFVRPHRALKFGRMCRTPAMQAGVASIAPDLERHLHGAWTLSTFGCRRRAYSRDCPIHRHGLNRAADGLVAARTQTGGLINSERRKDRSGSRSWTAERHGLCIKYLVDAAHAFTYRISY